MRRKVYDKLLRWKRERKGEVALLLQGARRIGKSYIAEAFAEAEYESYIIVDFAKTPDTVKDFFSAYLDDIDTLLWSLETYFHKRLTPRAGKGEEASSLIIFDEIQFCPKARAAIKYLVADGRYDYIETGSLISIKKNVKGILIPSEEHSLDMYPMDFEEFLWAMGEDMLMPYLQKQFEKRKPAGAFHRQAMNLFRQYMIVGGMPQAVKKFAETQDFEKVDEIKREIISLYRNDIYNYADSQEVKVLAIFDSIPGQLQKHEKKFKLASLENEARMRDYDEAFFWLNDAKIINCCYNSTEPSIGLRLNEDRTTLKCYMGDTGLLISMAFDERGIANTDLYNKLMFGKLEVNEGMLVENIVAQMLRAAGHNLFFYSNYSKEAEDRMVIDFLISKPTITSRHNISAVEVKSGASLSIVSLKKCIQKYAEQMNEPFVLCDRDLYVNDGITYLPLYMTSFL